MTLQERKNEIIRLEKLIEQKENEIKETKKLADQYNASQLALKLVLNGSYGYLANKHAACFCNGVAATITAHGRDLIQYMEKNNENYWYNEFHLDKELHFEVVRFGLILDHFDKYNLNHDILTTTEFIEYLTTSKLSADTEKARNQEIEFKNILDKIDFTNIVVPEITPIINTYINYETGLEELNPKHSDIFNTGQTLRKDPVSVYCDTDSLFVGFKPFFKKMNIEKNQLDYVLFVSKIRLQPVFKQKLEDYAKKYDVSNVQDFELEQISKSVIYLEKKMYIKNVVWEEGVLSESETNLQAKGIDLVRSSSSSFTRKHCYDIINYFFKNPETYSDRELVKLVKNLKELFLLASVDEISMNTGCNNYSRQVDDDVNTFKIKGSTHHGVKAACLHNFILNQNPEFKKQYNTIKGGKIKYYYTTNPHSNEFGYQIYPKELATKYAPIDYNTQFDKSILSIVNRFCKVLKLTELTPDLKWSKGLNNMFN